MVVAVAAATVVLGEPRTCPGGGTVAAGTALTAVVRAVDPAAGATVVAAPFGAGGAVTRVRLGVAWRCAVGGRVTDGEA